MRLIKAESHQAVVKLLNWVFGGGAFFVLLAKIAKFYAAIDQHAGPEKYWLTFSTTWLTDFSAGYVRRGLCGAILRWLYLHFRIEPQWPILVLPIVFFSILVVIAYRAFSRRNLCWWPIALTVCLGGLELCNKDGLVMLLVIATFWASTNMRNTVLRYFLIDVIGIVVVNVHEMSFFAMIPLLCLLTCFDEDIHLDALLRTVLLLPIAIAFAFVAVNTGSPEVSQQIIGNWQAILPAWWNGAELRGIFCDVGSTPSRVLHIFHDTMTGTWLRLPHYFYFCCEVIATFIVVSRLPFCLSSNSDGSRIVSRMLTLQATSIIVVFPFFFDYSRLFGYWTFPVLMCYVIIPQAKWTHILHACNQLPICRLLTRRDGIYCIPNHLVIFLALFVGMTEIGFSPRRSLYRSTVGQYLSTLILDMHRAGGDLSSWWHDQALRN